MTDTNHTAGNSKDGNTNLSFTEASISKEPSEVVLHAGICAGAVGWLAVLPWQVMGSEEFLNRLVEALGIIIDKRPKRRPRKIESYTKDIARPQLISRPQ